MVGRAGGGTSSNAVPEGPASPEAELGAWRELGPVVVVVVLAVAVLAGLAVLPARTWWAQRQNMNDARAELVRVGAEVETLRAELERLQTDDEIERLARRDYDLVFPGEESYRIVPPTSRP